MKNDVRDLGLVLDSPVRLIVIESWDERRVLETLTGLAISRGLALHLWSATEGLRKTAFGGEALDGVKAARQMWRSNVSSSIKWAAFTYSAICILILINRPWCG